MYDSALVSLTIIGCGIIFLALVTPGWLGFDIKSPKEDKNIDVSGVGLSHLHHNKESTSPQP